MSSYFLPAIPFIKYYFALEIKVTFPWNGDSAFFDVLFLFMIYLCYLKGC